MENIALLKYSRSVIIMFCLLHCVSHVAGEACEVVGGPLEVLDVFLFFHRGTYSLLFSLHPLERLILGPLCYIYVIEGLSPHWYAESSIHSQKGAAITYFEQRQIMSSILYLNRSAQTLEKYMVIDESTAFKALKAISYHKSQVLLLQSVFLLQQSKWNQFQPAGVVQSCATQIQGCCYPKLHQMLQCCEMIMRNEIRNYFHPLFACEIVFSS